MKIIVVYKSSTGFTQQYAKWIAEECNCQTYPMKEVTESMIRESDKVIYGGWIMGNMIVDLEKIKKMDPKELVVFAVGSTPVDIIDQKEIVKQNQLEGIPFFYLTGGLRFKKLNFFVRMMLKTLKKSAAKKENKTPQEQFMADHLGTEFDYSDKNSIKPLVEEVMN